MSVAFRCCRCREFFDGSSAVVVSFTPFIGMDSVELCQACRDALKRWLSEPPAKEMRR